MATGFPLGPTRTFHSELSPLRESRAPILILGVLQVLIGGAALVLSVAATFAAMILIGVAALVGGGVQLAAAFTSRRWQGVVQHLLIALLYLVFGFLVLSRPLMAMETLTLLLAVMLFVGGLFRVIVSAAVRFHNWGWSLVSGLVSVLLGVLIWADWPVSGLWVIGMFVGIDLIFSGWMWVALGLSLGDLREPAGGVPPGAALPPE